MLAVNLFVDVLPGFALVVAVPLVLWWYVRKQRGSSPNRLRITDKAALGKNTWVAVIEVDEQRFLVSELEALPEAALAPATDADAAQLNGITEQPRNGLIRRLQLMTVRGPAQSPWRSFGASRK
jgi:flagellar biogenesis protein FliO